MRYVFLAWFAVTFMLVLWALSDYFFGAATLKRLFIRIGLAFVWPLAGLSKAGRDILLNEVIT